MAEQQGIDPLAWNAQAVTMSYERARRGRAVGEHADGFTVTASRTMAVPVERLYDAFMADDVRGRWLTDGHLHTRTSTRPRRAHFDWGDGESRVHVTFDAKSEAKEHRVRLARTAGRCAHGRGHEARAGGTASPD